MGEIWRGGLKSDKIYKEKVRDDKGKYREPSVRSGGAHLNDKRKGIKFSFSIASKGGGDTSVYLWFGSEDFKKIASSMMSADPEAAEEAFKAAMAPKNASTGKQDASGSDAKADHRHFVLVRPAGGKWHVEGGPFSKERAQEVVEEQWKLGNQARVHVIEGTWDNFQTWFK